jgi:hypothetical protein
MFASGGSLGSGPAQACWQTSPTTCRSASWMPLTAWFRSRSSCLKVRRARSAALGSVEYFKLVLPAHLVGLLGGDCPPLRGGRTPREMPASVTLASLVDQTVLRDRTCPLIPAAQRMTAWTAGGRHLGTGWRLREYAGLSGNRLVPQGTGLREDRRDGPHEGIAPAENNQRAPGEHGDRRHAPVRIQAPQQVSPGEGKGAAEPGDAHGDRRTA